MPGGSASNLVAYIARGEMGLSVMMTTASTLAAIVTTPLLTTLLVGTLVAVDPAAMFLSTLQARARGGGAAGAAAAQLTSACRRLRPAPPRSPAHALQTLKPPPTTHPSTTCYPNPHKTLLQNPPKPPKTRK